MREIQVDVVHAGTPGQADRTIMPGAICPLCGLEPASDQAVLRIEDYKAGPGVRQHVLCKSCVQLLLDATMDDERTPFTRPYAHIGN